MIPHRLRSKVLSSSLSFRLRLDVASAWGSQSLTARNFLKSRPSCFQEPAGRFRLYGVTTYEN
jgi:hypothetical protein